MNQIKKIVTDLSSFPGPVVRGPGVRVWVSSGGSVAFPCNIEPDEPGETVSTVLWYRENKGEPIYT
jgi:hypothetical protein